MKIDAGEQLKEGKIDEALIVYQNALKKIQLNNSEDVILYCGILLNKCVGHLKKEELDDIISTCIRGIKIIKNFRGKVHQYTKLMKEQKD